ncbi:MAG: alpha/beta hydrolase [SAR202 cluster bacterium]|jgi:non-heme chloroperoxidase|nr:alpha/beta hydrolase [SAR202 cluster bacterium]MDP6800788.1 alpha/beta hydrolase [SAR202 cluster bacterium]
MQPVIPSPSQPLSVNPVWVGDNQAVRLYDYGGSGLPLLFVHGAFGHARVWDHAITSLGRDLHPFALDLIGHGESDWGANEQRYDFSRLVEDLKKCLAAMPDKPAVVGHSIGAVLSMMLAADYADHLSAAAFLDIDPFPPTRQAARLNNIGQRVPRTFRSRDELQEVVSKGAPQASARVRDHLCDHGYRRSGDGFQQRFDQRFLRSIRSWDVRGTLPDISIPALLLRGADSTVMTDNGVRDLRSGIPQLKFAAVPSATHQLHLDRPTEVGAAIGDFCRRL